MVFVPEKASHILFSDGGVVHYQGGEMPRFRRQSKSLKGQSTRFKGPRPDLVPEGIERDPFGRGCTRNVEGADGMMSRNKLPPLIYHPEIDFQERI